MAEFEGVGKRVAGTVKIYRLAREKGLPWWLRLQVAAAYLREGAAGFSMIEMRPGDGWWGRRAAPPQGTTTPPDSSTPQRGP